VDALVKQQWIDALRSGNYHQTRGCIRKIYKVGDQSLHIYHCVYGVLVAISPYPIFDSTHYTEDVLGWAGLTRIDLCNILTLNDTTTMNLDELAKWIDENL
jgi:hypothetical protein